ncbi:FAD-dependent oxidoreductase [Lacticaseibacillus brantae]|uniref:NADH oxidase n=1 Tax=Lacticaseibacillus brantae DSM 23927 TaxID=1423727 RepID=A0A0R2AYE7_9LACO|nr:FAD-dependent oxidoreductase [Lacticaseibacillus brantae]KRM72385.1 NADH oxidase [Lacticaseibacillus brantae DSM 23927]
MKVVVIGCTHAGTAAVKEILNSHPETEVTVYERNDNISFLSCGIALYLDGQVKTLEEMFYASADELRAMGATVRLRHDVLKVDAAEKTLTAQDMDSYAILHDSFDKLIVATGSAVSVPPLQGIDHQRVLLCKTYLQAKAVYDTAQENHDIALIGGGYVNVELAESYRKTGHEVTLYQSRDQLLPNYLDTDMAVRVAQLLADNGVRIQLNHRVNGFTEDETGLTIETNQGDYRADLAIVSTGFVPQTDLLRGQVALDRSGAIITDEYGRASNHDIFAAGDSRVSRFNATGNNAYLPNASNAVRQGLLAGINVFGELRADMGTQGTSAMMLFGYTLATTGITLGNAKLRGIDAASTTFVDMYRPEFMPTTDEITITLVYEKQTRRILGAQMLSKHEISQSANTLSLAIQNQNTLDDLAFVDMLFQPNYDRPFNYLNLAAQQALKAEGLL